MNKPTTLYDAVMGFSQSPLVTKNPKLFGNLKTALNKYSPIVYGYTGDCPLEERLTHVPIQKAKNIVKDFCNLEQNLLSQGLNPGTFNNYKSAINRFDRWMKSEPWYNEVMGTYNGKFCPIISLGNTVNMRSKGRRQKGANPFALKKEQLTPHLQEQFKLLHQFLTAPMVSKRKGKPIREITYQGYEFSILSFLGWKHNIQKMPLSDLDIRLMVNDGSELPMDTLDSYIEWGINEKGNGYAWAIYAGCAALNVAKCFYGGKSKKASFRDIEEVEEIRGRINDLNKLLKSSDSRLNLEEKLIDFSSLLECIQYLKNCTAPYDAHGNKRTLNAICQSFQRYLIVSYLAYVPVRQREIRELEFGVTLFKVDDKYLVKLSPDKQKNGSKTGKGREYFLPDVLTEDLDYWVNVLRPQLGIETNFLFCSLCLQFPKKHGKPFAASNFSTLVKAVMYRATLTLFGDAKNPTPHDFRRIAITYQRQFGDPSQQKGFAELMGHRVEEADRTYDQTTSLQKTSQASDWWEAKPADRPVNPAPVHPPIPKLPNPKKDQP